MDKTTAQEVTPLIMTLLPAKPGTCPECAVTHDPEEPHNKQSLYYQVKFYNQHKRYPAWSDAMEHCSAEMRSAWIKELARLGIVILSQSPRTAPEGVYLCSEDEGVNHG